MPDTTPFGPATAAAVARARQHSVGDLLGPTALRRPGELAVVDADPRVTFAGFDGAVDRTAHALAAEHVAAHERPTSVVLAGALPENPSGEVLERDLRAQHAAPAEG